MSTRSYRTRTLTKNAKEDPYDNDNRSLYSVSYGPSKSQKPAKVTLADLGAMQRTSSQRSSLRESRLQAAISYAKADQPAAKKAEETRDERRPSDARANQVEGLKGTINYPKPADANAVKEPHQCKFESELLKEAMKTAFGSNPHVNIDTEAEYYDTVKRLDICGKCWAAQQKFYTNPFKIKHRGPGQSLYQRDYVKHPLNETGPTLKNDFYTTFQNNVPMDFGTTMRNDYKAWNVGPVKKESMNFRPATTGIPFAGKSQYKSEYANWGANLTAYEKAPQGLTTIPELPFIANTSYRDNYAMPDATQQLKPKDQRGKKPPITAAIPFQGESQNAATYKPFKVEPAPVFEMDDEYAPTEALPEHHRSLYHKDFNPKPNWVCPAVIFMEQTPHPKQKYLHAE